MTRAEKVEALQAKAADLLQWFHGKQLPVAPFFLKPFAKVINTEQFFSTQTQRMEAHHKNPFNVIYVRAYEALFDLKTYMNELTKDNGQPGTLPRTGKAGS